MEKDIEKLKEMMKNAGLKIDEAYDLQNNKSVDISKPGRDDVKKDIDDYLDK